MKALIGYARVSTQGQDLELQEQELKKIGCNTIYAEKITGTKREREELNKMLSSLKEGDMVVVTKLDRIARNTKDGIEIIEKILSLGASLRVMNMGLFENTPTGKLLMNVMLAFAEFERDMIVERTREGKRIAKLKEGFKEGRPNLDVDIENGLKLIEGGLSVKNTCELLGISRSTWYNKVKVNN